MRNTRRGHSQKNWKLPLFNGKEKWEVWFNRFEAVASRGGWSSEEKLDELLPRLQGVAGDFVYSQLSARTRSSYKRLTRELGNRFMQVEVSKTYQVQFSKRNQKSTESVEDYAVELKRLYDKGHATRPLVIRQEDLLRRFLYGLADRKVAQQVEFVKEHKTIDEAVVEVVSYMESSRRVKGSDGYADKKGIYMIRPADSDDLDSDSDESSQRVARLPQNSKEPAKSTQINTEADIREIKNQLVSLSEQLKASLVGSQNQHKSTNHTGHQASDLNSTGRGRGWSNNNHGGNRYNTQSGRANHNRSYLHTQQTQRACYACGNERHFARDCPTRQGQMQQNTPIHDSQSWSENTNWVAGSATHNSANTQHFNRSSLMPEGQQNNTAMLQGGSTDTMRKQTESSGHHTSVLGN